MASIAIKKTIPKYSSDMQSYDMKLEIESADGMPREIFVFKRGLPQMPAPGTQAPASPPADWFISIADPVDLEEYPVNSPDTGNDCPYFRVDSVTFKYRSILDLQADWGYISEDVQGLVDAINAAAEPGSTETVEFT